MDYQVQLNNGRVIDLKNAEFDAAAFTETLNNQKINFVNIGGAIVNKHIIVSIIPVVAATKEVMEAVTGEKAAEPEVEKQA